MIPFFIIAGAVGKGNGYFNLQPTYAFQANQFTNGQDCQGDIQVFTGTGALNWNGDTGGVDQDLDWWTPRGTVKGTWVAKLDYSSGTNQFFATGSDSLGSYHTDPQWNFRKAPSGGSGGTTVGNYTLSLSNDGGSTAYDTSTVTITLFEDTL